jgi:manganese transport protein
LSGEGRAGRAQWVNLGLWFVLEVAIAATDLAEVIGSATAIYLLSNGAVPLWAGVLITAVDVLVVLLLGTRNFRVLELLVGSLILLIAGIFACGPRPARPRAAPALAGVVPAGRAC